MSKFPGFVINLERRTDRLAAFPAGVGNALSFVDFQTVKAVDGREIDLEELRPRVNPWNFEHMTEPRLRGYMGNALSLSVFRHVASREERYSFVFEDDARLTSHRLVNALRHLYLNAPQCDIIWLNDYDRSLTKAQRIEKRVRLTAASVFPFLSLRPWSAETEKTTEALCRRCDRQKTHQVAPDVSTLGGKGCAISPARVRHF